MTQVSLQHLRQRPFGGHPVIRIEQQGGTIEVLLRLGRAGDRKVHRAERVGLLPRGLTARGLGKNYEHKRGYGSRIDCFS